MQPPEDYREKNIQGVIGELLNAGPDFENRLCAIRTKGIEECACMQERVSNDHSRTLTPPFYKNSAIAKPKQTRYAKWEQQRRRGKKQGDQRKENQAKLRNMWMHKT